MEQKKLQAAIEAILFAMGGSVELKKLAQAIGHDEETTKKVIRQMMDRYEKEDRGIRIIDVRILTMQDTRRLVRLPSRRIKLSVFIRNKDV